MKEKSVHKAALLPSLFLAPIAYYCKLYAYETIIIDGGEHYVKQTYRNRCEIATPQGLQSLTIPVERTGEGWHTAMRDVRMSSHGNWKHLHWQALTTAYDGSPYFEYYMDELREIYGTASNSLFDFNETLREKVCEWLDIQPNIFVSDNYVQATDEMDDFRCAFSPKHKVMDNLFSLQKYHQVFELKQGFMSNLSILDLVFNMGRESLLVLRDSVAFVQS